MTTPMMMMMMELCRGQLSHLTAADATNVSRGNIRITRAFTYVVTQWFSATAF